jgi:hypothetical protein
MIAAVWISTACGRLQFDPLARSDATPDDAALGDSMIVHQDVFVAHVIIPGAITDSFTAHADVSGSAVVMQVSCNGGAVPSAVSVSAPGWTFQQLGPITASPSKDCATTMFAIAPDTLTTTITVSWTGSTCQLSNAALGDEFAAIAPAGGVTFDGVNAIGDSVDRTATVPTNQGDDAVWAALLSHGAGATIGVGYTKGADDATGDWSEYALRSDPAGTLENVTFSSANVSYVLSMVTLKTN